MKDYEILLKNTNLRYHFSKEFERHRIICARDKKKEINVFFIPSVSTIATLSVTWIATKESLTPYQTGWVASAPLLFVVLWGIVVGLSKVGRYLISKWEKFYTSQIIASKPASFSEATKEANKFNFEIFNLMFLAYCLQKEKEIDPNIRTYNILESIFYLNLALDKIIKMNATYNNLIEQHISESRISYCMKLGRMIISKLNKSDKKELLQCDILSLEDKYNSCVSNLEKNIKKTRKSNE